MCNLLPRLAQRYREGGEARRDAPPSRVMNMYVCSMYVSMYVCMHTWAVSPIGLTDGPSHTPASVSCRLVPLWAFFGGLSASLCSVLSPVVSALVAGALGLRSALRLLPPALPRFLRPRGLSPRPSGGWFCCSSLLLPAWSCLAGRSCCPVLPRSLDTGHSRSRSHSLAQRRARNESVPHGPPQ